jgi:hypothetical protein
MKRRISPSRPIPESSFGRVPIAGASVFASPDRRSCLAEGGGPHVQGAVVLRRGGRIVAGCFGPQGRPTLRRRPGQDVGKRAGRRSAIVGR